MPTANVDEALAAEARASLKHLGEGDTKVLDASVTRVVDLTESDAWLITLVLPRPRGSSWDVDRTIALRQEARRRVDELAAERHLELDGTTSVVLSTQQAPIDEIAVDDEPVDDERDGAFWRSSEEE